MLVDFVAEFIYSYVLDLYCIVSFVDGVVKCIDLYTLGLNSIALLVDGVVECIYSYVLGLYCIVSFVDSVVKCNDCRL